MIKSFVMAILSSSKSRDKMKIVLGITIGLCFSFSSLKAQNPLSQKVQSEFALGASLPFLHSGVELMQSAAIRQSGKSYYADAQGNRRDVGNYSNLVGWSVGIAYYIPVKRVKGLLLGSAVRTSLTGSQPQQVGYEEGYFFNFLSFGVAAKYYPFTHNNLFFKADGGLASVFTKNRYQTEQNQQSFHHQFGIGTNTSVGVGYSLTPFKNSSKLIDLQAIYQFNSTRVEVNGIGNDQWNYTALTFMVAINF